MKKKMLIGKRILIYAMTASLVLGEAGLTLTPVMATEVAQEDVAAVEEAAEAVEAPVAEAEDEAVEMATETGSEEVAEVAAAVAGKVTGVVIATEDVTSPTLRWNAVEGADWYEISITDSKGNYYGYSPDKTETGYEPNYRTISVSTYPSSYLSNNAGFNGYSLTTGEEVKDAAGNVVKTFQTGEVYTIRLRAVIDGDTADTYGEWSDAVTWQVASTMTPVTGLAYAKADEDRYYFTYNAVIDNSTIYYQYSKDPNFSDKSYWSDSYIYAGSSNYTLLSFSKGNFDAATTYYVRAINYPKNAAKGIWELTDAEIAALAPAVASFTTEAPKPAPTASAITNLRVYKEGSDYWALRFDADFNNEEDDYTEYCRAYYTETPADETSWQIIDDDDYDNDKNGLNIYKSSFTAGKTYYIRVQSYIYYYDDNGNQVKGTPSNVITVTVPTATSAIGTIALDENTESRWGSNYFTFTYSGNVALSEDIYYDYSESPNFDTNREVDTDINNSTDANTNKNFTINYSNLKPGRTYYVRARVYNSKAEEDARYSAYSNTVKISTKIPSIQLDATTTGKKSIQLSAYPNTTSYLTGFVYQRKDGKKWVDLKQTADDTYTNKKLKENTTYEFRARAYYFDPDTMKTTYGEWAYTDATTWGGALNLEGKASGKTAVKLTWKKVPGAKGYEIYRYSGSGSAFQTSNGFGTAYDQYKLVKTAGAGAKSYTDKGLTSGRSYSYKVVAYKMLAGKKVTITEEVSVDLGFEMTGVKKVYKANGTVKVTWNPVYNAKGYLIEKKDNATGQWTTFKTIKKVKTTSVTLPATADNNGVEYRIRAYKGTKYSTSASVTVTPPLAAPTGVKATVKNGAVTVTWKPVPGADYYRVYKTTSSYAYYNKDTKSYSYSGGYYAPLYVADNTQASGYKYVSPYSDDYEEYATGTTYVDQKISYKKDGVEVVVYDGPETGVTTYYYVVACKKGVKVNDGSCYEGDIVLKSSGRSKAAKATVKAPAPKNVTLSSAKAAKKKVTISFKAVADVDGYDIFRSTSKKKGYEVIGTADADATSYVDKYSKKNKIKKGKTYYYKVKAFVYDDAGNKVYSKKYSKVKSAKAK